MTDPVPPNPPPPGPSSGVVTSTGLDPKLAGLLCYVLGIITGLIFFLIEKTNDVVRFHAAQSIVVSIAMFVLWIALGILQFIVWQVSWTLGGVFSMLMTLVGLGMFIVWVLLMIKGYSGTKWKLPVIGDIAERMASGAAGEV